MTPYGFAILATVLTGFLPWSYVFEALGKLTSAPRLPLLLALGFVGVSTLTYILMLIQYAPDGRGWMMIAFLALTMHMTSIALGGLIWAMAGLRQARRFLDRPHIFLFLALASSLAALGLGLIFIPES